MPTPEEKARHKALKHAMRQAERDAIRSTLPLTPAQMRNLFDYLDEQLSDTKCDGTLQMTLAFLGRDQLPISAVVAWLESTGGHCDCEVLANSEQKFLFAFPEQG